jgi:G3E family GTPase
VFRLFSTASDDVAERKPVPMTLLSGFLGTGKTSALKHLLENKDNLKVGVIVNDVASVNIDAKLLMSGNNMASGDMVELQNGCACCSLADELFFSVEKLLTGRDLDAIVVELSGVADPMAIKSNWVSAPDAVRKQAEISKVVTVIDAGTFGQDYMTWDIAGERDQWTEQGDDCSANRKVAELLAEQVEAANLILVNKCDLASAEEIKVATAMAKALNKDADLVEVQYGRISPSDLIATIAPVEQIENGHSHAHDDHACKEPECTDTSHSHAHDDHACSEPECADTSHSHAHDDHACSEPDCTDTSHSHSHSHATSIEELGISSFVYKATVPFNPRRLMKILNQWPVPVIDILDLGALQEPEKSGGRFTNKDSPFRGVLRSKGFCWFAPNKWSGSNDDPWRHDTAMFWSHAGKHFSVTAAGKWWGTISKSQMQKYFAGNEEEFERIVKEDFQTEEFGDRRQELVFIGTNLEEDKIIATLDDCLMTESEMTKYRQQLKNYMDTIISSSPSKGLFDLGSINHTDGDRV